MKYFGHSILLIFFVSLFHACNNPLEDVSIKIKDALTESAINLTYRNSVTSDTTLRPKAIKFTFLGEDAEAIVSSVGNKKISISSEGVLGIAIAPDYVKRPANIIVAASLEGYLTDLNTITLANKANVNRTIRLLKIDNLPNGMSVDVQAVESANLLSKSLSLVTKGKNEGVMLSLPTSLKVSANNNQELSGNLSVELSHFENAARGFVPNNGTVYQAIGLDGKVLPPFDFITYGFFAVKVLDAAFHQGLSFSKQASIEMSIHENSTHTNGQKVKVGDTLPFWGYVNNVWKMLDNPVVERNANGKLCIKTQITQLGYYAVGEMIPVCVKGPTLKVTSAFQGLDIVYLSRLIEVSSGKSIADVYLNLNNGASNSLAGRRKNRVYLQLFNYNNQYGGDLSKPIFQSQPFDLCEEQTIPVNVPTPAPRAINVELIIECAKGQVVNNQTVPAKVDIQFQPKGSSDWRDLMTLTRNQLKGSTYKLKYGNTYSIRASPNPAQGWLFYKRDTLINTTNYRFYIENKDYCK